VTPPTWLYWPAAAAAPWVPSDVSGLLAWYKADSISQSDDTNVTSWTNSQGTSGRDLVDAGTAPKFRTNVQNSLPVVRFGGSGNLVCSSASWLPNLKSAITVGGAVKVVSAAEHQFVTAMPLSGNASVPRADLLRMSVNTWRTVRANPAATFLFRDGPSHSGTGYLLPVFSMNSSQVPTHRVDGTAASLSAGNYSSVTDGNPASLMLGSLWNNGNYASRLPNTAEIAEIVIYDSALSTADAERLEGYLAHKWGLTGNLPGASPGPEHPYKNSPP
jgi:hypothetical protein